MTWPGDVIIGSWVVFLIYWYMSAAGVKATAIRQSLPAQAAWRLPLMAAAVLLLFEPRHGLEAPLLAMSPNVWAAGAVITVLGLIICIWARRTLGGNWSSAVTLKHDHELIQTGPYRWVRNPIYAGLLVMFAGTAVAYGSLAALSAVVLAAVALWIKLKQEEALMQQQFPEAYAIYRRRVRALIPFLL